MSNDKKGLMIGAGLGAVVGYYAYAKSGKKDGKAKVPIAGFELGKLPYIALFAALGGFGGHMAQSKGIKPFAAPLGGGKLGMPNYGTNAYSDYVMM